MNRVNYPLAKDQGALRWAFLLESAKEWSWEPVFRLELPLVGM